MVRRGSAGIVIGVPGLSVFHLGGKLLMYASRSTPQPETTATQRVYDLIGGLLSEGEVKAEQQAAAPHGGSGRERRHAGAVAGRRHVPDRLRERILAVERQPGAAEHKRIAADPERERVNVALG